MKEGNNKKFKGDVSIGLISSKMTIEGPFIKEKVLLLYQVEELLDLLMKPFIESEENTIDNFNLYFYDLNKN